MCAAFNAAIRKSSDSRGVELFKDSGGFDEFFPRDDDFQGHDALLKRYPNLDTFETKSGFFGRQIKSSLGNTLRLLDPLVILDEGQKAYSLLARETIEGFNPSMIVELSATPPNLANVLVDIRGQALANEGMVKLDLHIENSNSASPDPSFLAFSSLFTNLLPSHIGGQRSSNERKIEAGCECCTFAPASIR